MSNSELNSLFFTVNTPPYESKDENDNNDDGKCSPTFDYAAWMMEDELYQENQNIAIASLINNLNKSLYDLLSIKQLLLIVSYYKLPLKTNKNKKSDIIDKIYEFESNPQNQSITLERKKKWMYMKEIYDDKILKKYILGEW